MKDKIVTFMKQPIFIFFLCLAILLSGGVVGVFALYRAQQEAEAPVYTAPFAFTSDYLTETGGTYTVYGSSVTFFLSNADGLTITKAPLVYEVSSTDGGTLNLTQGTLAGGETRTASITLTGMGSVTVTAKALAPFQKTLKATFNFTELRSYYKIVDSGSTVTVHLYTGVDLPPNGFTFVRGNYLTYQSGTGGTATLSADGLTTVVTGLQANSYYLFTFQETTAGGGRDYGISERVLSDGAISFYKDNFGVWDWGDLQPVYTVSFDTNGATTEGYGVAVGKNDYVDEPDVPVKVSKTVDYEFLGWYVDGDLNQKWDFNTDKVTQNVNLVAMYSDEKQSTDLYV